LLNLSKK